MLSRIRGVFLRYLDEHLEHDFGAFDLGADGRVEQAQLRSGRLDLEGWTTAEQIALVDDTRTVPAVLAGSADAPRQFHLSRTAGRSSPTIKLTFADGTTSRFAVPSWSGPSLNFAKARIAMGFAAALLKSFPLLWRYSRTKDPVLRSQIGPALGFGQRSEHHLLRSSPYGAAGKPQDAPTAPITIILPVYNAFDLVKDCLSRVAAHTELPWRLIIVEDCSTDQSVRPWLRDWVANVVDGGAEVELLENETNRGFIGSVNRALERARTYGDHVVLLNSDALVPANWASRLLLPITRHADVATVTPLSNDAEIFTAPVICQRHTIAPGHGDALDRIACTFDQNADLVEAPTGVGFCMAMNASFIDKIPALDTVFGRGYGEEVDWCQRARALGGRHVACPWLFVEHRGGESFGSAEKQRLIQANGAVISTRYPTYDREVQAFLRNDPLITPRLTLGIGWLATVAKKAVPVYLAHSLGGGAEMWLQSKLATDLHDTGGAIVVRVGGAKRWQIELVTPFGTTLGETDDLAIVDDILRPLTLRHVVYSCGVGDSDPVELPSILSNWAGSSDRVEVLIHDFLPLSPSQTLLDHDNIYRGPFDADHTDKAHIAIRPDGTWVNLAEWRAAWGALIARADAVTVFSDNSAKLVAAAFPDARINVRPHSILEPLPALDRPKGKTRVVGVLGSINLHKGAEVVAKAARLASSGDDIKFVIIGTLDPAVAKPRGLTVHGPYQIAEIAELAGRYGVTDWLIPSIWPETFSYSTHECLATGLPVFAFDIGAQGDAVRTAHNGNVIKMEGNLAQAVIDALRQGPRQ